MTQSTPAVETGRTSAIPLARVDAREKVLGAAIYAADRHGPELAHAMLATATIGKGRVTRLDTTAATAVPGVLLVLTHLNIEGLTSPGFLQGGGYGFQSLQPLLGGRIAYRGQPIALVVAETLEAAIEAAHLVEAEYAEEPFAATIDDAGTETLDRAATLPPPMSVDKVVGDADGAYAGAEVRVDAVYDGPPQHQNPMELISTVAEWRDGTLVVHEGTQNAEGVRHGLARQLGLDPAQVEVRSSYLGGGFGQKNSVQAQTPLAALAARQLGRPVKLVVPRSHLFHDASFRPASRHHILLGGDQTGRMTAAVHEVDSQTSRHDLFAGAYTEVTSAFYGWPNFRGRERMVRTDTQTPGYMRAPFEHIAAFALESAVDEFASQIEMDLVVVRLMNDTQADPITGLLHSSRHAAACLERGAELFGWSVRSAVPGSMVGEDGSLIGWGVALGLYKASTAPAIARLRIDPSGQARVAVGGHEMGQGIRSAIAAIVSTTLAIPAEQVEIVVGETGTVPQHLTAGSWGTATAIPAVRQALDDLLARIAAFDPEPGTVRPPHEVLAATGREAVEVEARHKAPGQPNAIFDRLAQGLPAAAGPVYPEFVSFSHIAHFVEVRVEPSTRRVRVPRVVSVVDCGRVVSPVTAASQVRGGVVWGIGAALRERSEVDPRYGGFLNADIAEYVIPVNADIGEITVDFIDEPDPLLNRDGVKGVGEVVMAGEAAAIANAIFHATGQRHRSLPIRIEDML